MTRRREAGARFAIATLGLGAALGVSGCLAYHVVATPVKVAATTVIVAGETTGAAVKATGKVATSAFNAVGNVGSSGIDAAARLTQAGMVTFVDASTGTVTRVPWRDGFTLASAGAEARVVLVKRAIDVLRAGTVVYSSRHLADPGAPLASGDVVRVRG